MRFDYILSYVVIFPPFVCNVWYLFLSSNPSTPFLFMLMYSFIVLHFPTIWESLSMHSCACYHFGVPRCEHVNMGSSADVRVPRFAREVVPSPSKKCKMVTHSTPYRLVWMVFGPMLYCASILLCLFSMWLSFDIGKSQTPTKKWKVVIESSPYLLVWMHFDRMLSYVSILPHLFLMFVLPSCGAMSGPSSPHPLVHSYWCILLLFSIMHLFGCVIVLACQCVNMQMWLMVCIQQCRAVFERQCQGLLRKSKVMTNSPPYPLTWAFFPPMVSCVFFYRYLFVVLILFDVG